MYNIEDYIEKALCSLINQTVNNFEVILVDDGSTDKTYKKACDFLSKVEFKNYKIIKKSNGGVSSARNMGLTEANGDYVIFLDGDDYVSEKLVETILKKNQSEDSDIICWGYNIVRANNSTITNYFDKYKKISKVLSGIEAINSINNGNMKVCIGSAAFRRELLQKYSLNFTVGCANGEDQELTHKCLCNAKNVLFINEELLFYVQRYGSISNSFNFKRFDSIYAIRRTYEYLDSQNENCLKIFSKALKTEIIINNFFGNLNDCLRYYKAANKIKNFNNLLRIIEENYPGLIANMNIEFKSYNGTNLKTLAMTKTFLISPMVYAYFFYIGDNLKNLFLRNRRY